MAGPRAGAGLGHGAVRRKGGRAEPVPSRPAGSPRRPPCAEGELPGRRCRSHVTAPGARSAARSGGGCGARPGRQWASPPGAGFLPRRGMRRPPASALLLSWAPLPRRGRERVRGGGVAGSPLRSPLCRLRRRPQARLGSRHGAEAALQAGARVVSGPWEALSSPAAVRGCPRLPLFPLFRPWNRRGAGRCPRV